MRFVDGDSVIPIPHPATVIESERRRQVAKLRPRSTGTERQTTWELKQSIHHWDVRTSADLVTDSWPRSCRRLCPDKSWPGLYPPYRWVTQPSSACTRSTSAWAILRSPPSDWRSQPAGSRGHRGALRLEPGCDGRSEPSLRQQWWSPRESSAQFSSGVERLYASVSNHRPGRLPDFAGIS